MTTGYYLDTQRWDINLEGRGRSIHWTLALLITPIMGLMFLMFLPFIGFYLSLQALTQKVIGAIKPIFYHHNMAVGEAHILGSASNDAAQKSESPALEELSKEIDSRRK